MVGKSADAVESADVKMRPDKGKPPPDAFPRVRLCLDPCRGWNAFSRGKVKVWYCAQGTCGSLAEEVSALIEFGAPTTDQILSLLGDIDGHFAVVALGPRCLFAAVDRVRAIPLLWAKSAAGLVIGDHGQEFESVLDLDADSIDADAALAIAMSGYTIGDDTLYRDVSQLGPGQYLFATGTGFERGSYHRWRPWRPIEKSSDELAGELKSLNERIIEKLVRSLDGRRVIVPLSAGMDSRLIASGLAEAGYRNVLCVAYGRSGNHEAETSRKVALRLGYDWLFVPYNHRTLRAAMVTPEYCRFEDTSDSLTGIHFMQEFLLFKELARQRRLEPRSVVVNGQAGDFISGNHIPPAFYSEFQKGKKPGRRMQRVIDPMLRKHYRLWSSLMDSNRLQRISARLEREIETIGGLPDRPEHDFGVYEFLEFWNRQSKYVLNGQRHYEFFGLDWRLPLWDREYMDFWSRAPLAAKTRQTLYKTVLADQDWGGVWRDIPVNERKIRPLAMIPARFAAKAMFVPLGRDRWHRFEHRFLEYWMHPICSYAPWPYSTVAFDRRGSTNPFSYVTEDYLAGKNLNYAGEPVT